MLTRLEVDGFKNLVEFAVDFGPLTCIAGPNGIGKSNMFDAIRFLSLLADRPILEAAAAVCTCGGNPGCPDDLFFHSNSMQRHSFRIAVEMLVERQVCDDFGRPGTATSTFLRYEIEIGRGTGVPKDRARHSDIELRSESLRQIRKGDAAKRLRFPHSRSRFRDRAVHNERRSKSGYISTEQGNGTGAEIVIHQDGGSTGLGRGAPARHAPRTIVGTTTTIATPTILAARREMQGWRLLSLEPGVMGRPDRLGRDPDTVSDNGAHLAAALCRLNDSRETGDGDVIATVSSRLSELIPVCRVDVVRDEARHLLGLSITDRDGQHFPARGISDGTLRFLALAILAEDPEAGRLLCIEEPERGIHPRRLDSMASLVRDLAVDAGEEPGDGNAMRQVIVATYSPHFLRLQNEDDVLLARDVAVRGDAGAISLRCDPLKGTWRAGLDGSEHASGVSMMLDDLQPPLNAQLSLPLEFHAAGSTPDS